MGWPPSLPPVREVPWSIQLLFRRLRWWFSVLLSRVVWWFETLKMEAVRPPKRLFPITKLNGATTQRTMAFVSLPWKPRIVHVNNCSRSNYGNCSWKDPTFCNRNYTLSYSDPDFEYNNNNNIICCVNQVLPLPTLHFAVQWCIRTANYFTTRLYPKVSGLAAWSENCKFYSPLPLGAVVSLFCELV
jgi:hypothetical protein